MHFKMASKIACIILIISIYIEQTQAASVGHRASQASNGPDQGRFQVKPDLDPNATCSAPLTYLSNPLIAMGCTWIVFLLIAIIIWIISSTLSSGTEVIHDGCTSSTAIFFYMVKVRVGKLPKDFYGLTKKKTAITMDLNDADNCFISRLSIPVETNPEKIHIMTKESRVIKFKVARMFAFPEIASIRFDHDCFREDIVIYGVEIKDLKDDSKTWKCKVNAKIRALGPVNDFADQVFKVKRRRQYGDTDDSIRTTDTEKKERSADPVIDNEQTTTLGCLEIWLSLWVGTNVVTCWMAAVNVQANMCHIQEPNDAIWKGMIAAAVAIGGTALLMLFYGFIKVKAANELGVYSALKWLVIFVMFLMGITFGALSVYAGSELRSLKLLLYGSGAGVCLLVLFTFVMWGIYGCLARRFRRQTFDIREADLEAARKEEAKKSALGSKSQDVPSPSEYIRIKSLEQPKTAALAAKPAPVKVDSAKSGFEIKSATPVDQKSTVIKKPTPVPGKAGAVDLKKKK
ncbi:hypothetical protein HDE_01889 [Halotydeus destructor]|nr:hypothetical protein HDE_01889 [Halotydeus destructor]